LRIRGILEIVYDKWVKVGSWVQEAWHLWSCCHFHL